LRTGRYLTISHQLRVLAVQSRFRAAVKRVIDKERWWHRHDWCKSDRNAYRDALLVFGHFSSTEHQRTASLRTIQQHAITSGDEPPVPINQEPKRQQHGWIISSEKETIGSVGSVGSVSSTDVSALSSQMRSFVAVHQRSQQIIVAELSLMRAEMSDLRRDVSNLAKEQNSNMYESAV
jgi:hypothetical protein